MNNKSLSYISIVCNVSLKILRKLEKRRTKEVGSLQAIVDLTLRNKNSAKILIEDLRYESCPSVNQSTVYRSLVRYSINGRVAGKKTIVNEGKRGKRLIKPDKRNVRKG